MRRETEAVSCYTENTSCIDFFILSVCTLKLNSPEIKTSVLPYTIL